MADRVLLADGDQLHEADELAWIERQIAALRGDDMARLDRTNLIAFLSDMAVSHESELESRLIVLYAHILKFQHQPEKATRSWLLTIREQQRAIRRLLKKLPSLKARANDIVEDIYPDAVETSMDETGRPRALFPSTPGDTLAEALAWDAEPPAPSEV